MPRRKKSTGPQLKFDKRLVLNQYVLGLLGADDFEDLAQPLKEEPEHEQLDEEGRTKILHALLARLPAGSPIAPNELRSYDENIVRQTRTISRRRPQPIRWKYFQYLALLFAEIYLDRYFRDAETLLKELNESVDMFNQGKHERDAVPRYEMEDLRKICFWMATGSGKTLIMHVNVLQYHHYLHRHRRGEEINRIILLTPNEGLSRQHLDDFAKSGFTRAEVFQRDAQLRLPAVGDTPAVEIIDIHKLRESAGEKTVAIEAFEGNNLVLVDEGHLGASGEEWMDKRDRLCREGFSFEYSATFGQAMKASKKQGLEDKYAKAILFDYSYKFFYDDGYGKNYWILNLAKDGSEETHKLYLTACLLSFYQQQRVFNDLREDLRPYNVEPPLWVFVGGSVSAVRTEKGKKVSDVVEVLLFLSEFVREKKATLKRLAKLLSGKSNVLDERGKDIFGMAFNYLHETGATADEVYDDVLRRFFNATGVGTLHVDLLKGTDGELALNVGNSEPFGVINVGDAPALWKLCKERDELKASERLFSGSLFREIRKPDSKINLLLGSKKFTEGWNSFRVSTMGLLNVGRTEGPQIIQLFGRGVRLWGANYGLKRSSHVEGLEPPRHLRNLETLNVFGVHADYMQQFREYLEEEGVPSDAEPQEIVLPVLKNLPFDHLKSLKLDEGVSFDKDGPDVRLGEVPLAMKNLNVSLNWYPRLQAKLSREILDMEIGGDMEKNVLKKEHMAFVDWRALHWELEQYKAERGYGKLSISIEEIRSAILDPSWYVLYVPPYELEIDSFDKVFRIRELVTALAKRYIDRFYRLARDEWERGHLKLVKLTEDDPNVNYELRFQVEASRAAIAKSLNDLKAHIDQGEMDDFKFGVIHGIIFGRHLYRPLIHLGKNGVTVSPVALKESERNFVENLRTFYTENLDFFDEASPKKDLYLLRNLSRGKGLGFFQQGNFYPDFILWLVVGKVQHIAFVDPKGIRNVYDDHPKIEFHKTVKQLEDDFAGENVTFDSFIVSITEHAKIEHTGRLSLEEFSKRNVFFQIDDKEQYIEKILKRMLGSSPKTEVPAQ